MAQSLSENTTNLAGFETALLSLYAKSGGSMKMTKYIDIASIRTHMHILFFILLHW